MCARANDTELVDNFSVRMIPYNALRQHRGEPKPCSNRVVNGVYTPASKRIFVDADSHHTCSADTAGWEGASSLF